MIDLEYLDGVISGEVSTYKFVNLKNIAKLGYSEQIEKLHDFFNKISNSLSSGLSDALTFSGNTSIQGQDDIRKAANLGFAKILELNKENSNSLLINIPESPTLSEKIDIVYSFQNVFKIL